MIQILDSLILVLFVLFLVYIFRGYHLTRLDRERKEGSNSNSDITKIIDSGREKKSEN